MGPARIAVPKPGPAKLTAGAGLDEWLEEAKQCHYLPEPVMKELCEIVKEVLMEGRQLPPRAPPNTLWGDPADTSFGSAVKNQISSR